MSLNFDRISTCSTKSGESARGPGGRGEGALRERERADREAPASAISGMMSDNGWKIYIGQINIITLSSIIWQVSAVKYYFKILNSWAFCFYLSPGQAQVVEELQQHTPNIVVWKNISKYYRVNLMPEFRYMYQPILRHLGSGHSTAWGSGSGVSGQDPSIALRFLSFIMILFTLHHFI